MKSTVDFEISVDIETLSMEQFNALVTLFGLKETLLTIRSTGNTSEQRADVWKEKEIKPAEATGMHTKEDFPPNGMIASEKTKEPENALKSAENLDVKEEIKPAETPKPTSSFTNPFASKAAPTAPDTVAPTAPKQPATFNNPFASKTAPTAPKQPATFNNPFASKTAPTAPAMSAAPNAVTTTQSEETSQSNQQSVINDVASKYPVSDRIQFDPSGSRFMIDGTEVSEMSIRMQAGLLTMQPAKMAALKERLASMGYTDIVSLVNAWNTSHDAREAAHIFEFIRSMLA